MRSVRLLLFFLLMLTHSAHVCRLRAGRLRSRWVSLLRIRESYLLNGDVLARGLPRRCERFTFVPRPRRLPRSNAHLLQTSPSGPHLP